MNECPVASTHTSHVHQTWIKRGSNVDDSLIFPDRRQMLCIGKINDS